MAQDPELSKIYMEQADQVYAEAKDAIEIAKDIYIQAAEADTMNVRANYMAGVLYLETVNRDYSTKYFERVKRLDPRYRFNIDYLLGRGYQYGLEFEKALKYFWPIKIDLLLIEVIEDKIKLQFMKSMIELKNAKMPKKLSGCLLPILSKM